MDHLARAVDSAIILLDPTKSCNGTFSHKAYLIGKSNLETKKKDTLLEALDLQAEDAKDQAARDVIYSLQTSCAEGKLPLWCATKENKEKAVEFFLAQGEKSGSLHVSTALSRKNSAMAKMLIKSGALNKGIFCFRLDSHPLVLALKNGELEVVDMILQSGIDLSEKHDEPAGQKITIPEYLQHINLALDPKYFNQSQSKKTTLAKQQEEFLECPICCDAKPESITTCKHSFCNNCLKEWLAAHDTCPVCRHKIK